MLGHHWRNRAMSPKQPKTLPRSQKVTSTLYGNAIGVRKCDFDCVRLANPKKVVLTVERYVHEIQICVRHRIEITSMKSRDNSRENWGLGPSDAKLRKNARIHVPCAALHKYPLKLIQTAAHSPALRSFSE